MIIDLHALVWLNLVIAVLNAGMCLWYLIDLKPVAAWRVAAAHIAISIYAFLAAFSLHVAPGGRP